MKKAKFKLVGTKPLLFNAFRPEMVSEESSTKPKTGKAGNNPEEWRERVFAEEKKLYLPDTYFFAFIRSGGSFIKVGRGTLQKKIIACITIPETKYFFLNRELPKIVEEIETGDLIKDSDQPVFLHVCGVTNPNTKGRNVRYRIGLGVGWEIEASVEWDDTIVSKSQMEACINSAAKLSGMADGRNNGYGRCIMEYFEIEK
jgi:hypothetical protein